MARMSLVAFSLAAVLALAGCGGGSTSNGNKLEGTVSINGPGGELIPIYKAAWFTPLTKKTGVKVKPSSGTEPEKYKAAIDAGNVPWDLIEYESGGQLLAAAKQGLLQPVDREKLASYMKQFGGDINDMLPGSVLKYGVWFGGFADILAFDKRVFQDGGPQPSSLLDLWNTKKFPGRRCLSSYAFGTLETALRADGVPESKLYPLDVNRALRKLDEIKGDVTKFWTEGSEPAQLISSGECVMSTIWNGRPYRAQKEGIDYLGVAWKDGIYHASFWAIPKGAPNPEAAYAALGYYELSKTGAVVANESGYGNGNAKTEGLANAGLKPYLAEASDNFRVLIKPNDRWWFKNSQQAEETYSTWQGGG